MCWIFFNSINQNLSLTVSSTHILLFVRFVAMFGSPGVTRLEDTPAFQSVCVRERERKREREREREREIRAVVSPLCLPLTELVVCDVSLRAPLITAYISTLPRPDYPPAELKSTEQVWLLSVCVYLVERVRERGTEGVRKNKRERPFSPL